MTVNDVAVDIHRGSAERWMRMRVRHELARTPNPESTGTRCGRTARMIGLRTSADRRGAADPGTESWFSADGRPLGERRKAGGVD